MKGTPRIARLYSSVRTAHLERFRQLDPSTVIYRYARYDFDASAVDLDPPPRQLGRLATIWHLVTHSYDVVEVNEPGVAWMWGDLLLQIAAVRLRSWMTRTHTAIVTYCIGVVDPADDAIGHRLLPRRLVVAASTPVMKALVASMTRIAFGTTGSHQMYARHVGADALAARSAFFEAIPARCDCLAPEGQVRNVNDVVFVGAFSDRKGIGQLMDVWEQLSVTAPHLRLKIIGKGDRAAEVMDWAHDRDEVTVRVDPPRDAIHRALRESGCLVLLSQRVGGWREQVGLPIVEALAHGCEVLATDETGLAPWLAAHGHGVVELDASAAYIAARLDAQVKNIRSREQVLADLPMTDQRLEADRWMVAGPAGRTSEKAESPAHW